MDSKFGKNGLLLSFWLLSGGCIMAIKNLVSRFIEINDFTSGLFDGIAISFVMSGLVCLFFYIRKELRNG